MVSKRLLSTAALVLPCLILASCASDSEEWIARDLAPLEALPLSPPADGRRAVPKGTFLRGDLISLTVYEGVRRAKRIARGEFTVDGAGEIYIPKIGTIRVEGLTPRAVEKAISSACLRSERALGVNFITMFESLNGASIVELVGGVRNPGMLTLGDQEITVSGAVAFAGGFTNPAETRTVTLVREGRRRPVLVGSPNFDGIEVEGGDRLEIE